MDVLFLIDTRISLNNKNLVYNFFLQNMGNEWMIYIFPGHSASGQGQSDAVGGIAIIVRCQIQSGWSVSKIYSDSSGCGLYLAAKMHHSDGRRVRVVGVYLPTRESDPSHLITPGGPSRRSPYSNLGPWQPRSGSSWLISRRNASF
jgi:hypothetical protein